ncbi:DNA-processing protein DprA [Paracoccus methylarcula]|uniref:DNA-protecting protein DprA n=1 Tax=Paracoccus methylarcula TaxID=72022 RepID=A0A422QYW4_9RHOB|nr:DNA-processing protein DprA [Paracoccus methylarcula]RNF35176.1 DNA-protecting protein DprA [Paracoccus methylarcula]
MDTGFVSFDFPSPRSTGENDDLAYLRLIRSHRVGPATFHRLLAEHGSASAALDALPEIAAAAGVRDYLPCPEAVAASELQAGHKARARLIRHDSPLYPQVLRQIDGAPAVLWLRGDPFWLAHDPVAVIGARNASSLGLRMARGMAAGLGKAGHAVVAGLARGIDTAAHGAALQTGTVAVLAGGIDAIYPAENASLAAEIAEKGALISEQPPGMKPAARHFPARNRIISGLSQAVVVIEAACRSGSLITAKFALDQGREVMAIPGHPMDARAAGCNQLIRDGAQLVRSAADVSEAISAHDRPRPEPAPTGDIPPSHEEIAAMEASRRPPAKARDHGGPASLEERILARLTPSPIEENDLIRDLGLPASTVNAAIQALELQGSLTRLTGGRIARL